MTAKQEKPTRKRNGGDEIFDSLSRIFELFIEHSRMDATATLAVIEAIPIKSELQQKWVTYWKANVLLHQEPCFGKHYRKAQRMLKALLPKSWLAIDEDERELIFHVMLTLGRSYTSSGEGNVNDAVEMLAELVALTRFHRSAMEQAAEEAFAVATQAMLDSYTYSLASAHEENQREKEEGEAA